MTIFLKKHFEPIRRLFLRYGIKSITIDDICSHLSISKKTLYNEYTNKEELIRDIFLYDFLEFKERLLSVSKQSPDAIEETCELVELILNKHLSFGTSTLYDMQKYYRWIYEEINKMMNESIQVSLSKSLLRGIQEGNFRKNLNSDLTASIIILTLNSGFFEKDKRTISFLLADIMDYHFRSICSPQGFRQWKKSKINRQIIY